MTSSSLILPGFSDCFRLAFPTHAERLIFLEAGVSSYDEGCQRINIADSSSGSEPSEGKPRCFGFGYHDTLILQLIFSTASERVYPPSATAILISGLP